MTPETLLEIARTVTILAFLGLGLIMMRGGEHTAMAIFFSTAAILGRIK